MQILIIQRFSDIELGLPVRELTIYLNDLSAHSPLVRLILFTL